MFVLGHKDNTDDIVIITDSDGDMRSTLEYVHEHPDWYEFIGLREVNNQTHYFYRFRE